MSSYRLILLKLKNENFEKDNSYINFYQNICESLFEKDDEENEILIILMKIFFEKDTYLEIKKDYSISLEDIDAILYGYRYCLNEVNDLKEDYIYSYLYDRNHIIDFNTKFYPGSDNKDEPYYDIYYKIINHFKEKPNEGCYVCLCDKGYYHSVFEGFPGKFEINMKCPNCGHDIGSKEYYKEERDENNKNKEIKFYQMVTNNSHYYRIFKDNEQIEDFKKNKEYYNKLKEMKFMTIKEFKEYYIIPLLYRKEKGLNRIDINTFNKENKIIRNLSQISYRLLNYILYCHLFFGKLFTQSDKFDNYLPEGISWINMIKKCFNKLKLELENKGIKNLDIFMNCIFKDLFKQLHNKECINNYEELIKFEDQLELLIQSKCK